MTGSGGKLLTAIYDLGWYAPTFDIFGFLLGALIWQRKHGFRGIRLVILKRPVAQALMLQPQSPPEYDFRIQDILVGAAGLFPIDKVEVTQEDSAACACTDPDSIFPQSWSYRLSRNELERHRYYLQGFLRDHVKGGEPLPGIRVPTFAFKKIRALLAKRPRPWISITARQTAYQAARNSNLATWQKVALHFRDRGASVFLIPDIESLENFDAPDPLAMMAVSNLGYRAALYDACDLNLAVPNGTTGPLQYNPSAPFLIAKFATEGTNSSMETVQRLMGLSPGDPFWNAVPWQQLLWSDDSDASQLIEEAERLLGFMDRMRTQIAGQPLVCDPWGKPDGTLRGLWGGVQTTMTEDALQAALAVQITAEGLPERIRNFGVYSCKPWIVASETHLAQGRFDDALAAARQAIWTDGRYARPYLIVAECLARKGQMNLGGRYYASAQSL